MTRRWDHSSVHWTICSSATYESTWRFSDQSNRCRELLSPLLVLINRSFERNSQDICLCYLRSSLISILFFWSTLSYGWLFGQNSGNNFFVDCDSFSQISSFWLAFEILSRENRASEWRRSVMNFLSLFFNRIDLSSLLISPPNLSRKRHSHVHWTTTLSLIINATS